MTKKAATKNDDANLPALWDEELAKEAREAAARETAGSNFISIKGNKFTYKGAPLGREIQVVVLAIGFVNEFYKADYDPDSPQAPDCYAAGLSDENLAPSDKVPDKQHPTCDGCWANAFNSGSRGKGKACRNRRRLVVIAVVDGQVSEEAAILTLPPTSLRSWGAYVKQLSGAMNRPPWSVITKFTLDEEADFPQPTPKLVEPITDKSLLVKLRALTAPAKEEATNTSAWEALAASAAAGDGPKKRISDQRQRQKVEPRQPQRGGGKTDAKQASGRRKF